MKQKAFFLPLAFAGLLWSCDSGGDGGGQSGGAAPDAGPPPAPTAEVLAELKAQPVGGKLVGNTVMLSGGEFVAADLAKAPEYYLVYYSASW